MIALNQCVEILYFSYDLYENMSLLSYGQLVGK